MKPGDRIRQGIKPDAHIKPIEATVIEVLEKGKGSHIPEGLGVVVEFEHMGETLQQTWPLWWDLEVIDNTKWYNCAHHDAGYPDQECTCEENEE
jgi:hypothetical protein